MKNTLLLISGLFTTGLFSQPVLVPTDVLPVGASYVQFNASNASVIDTTNTGPNSVWNFGSLTSSSNATITIQSPSSASGGSNFPGADFAQNVPGAGGASAGFTFFNAGATGLELMGISTQAGNFVFNPALTFIPSGLNFNGDFTGPVSAVLSSPGATTTRSGEQVISYDGYGSLTTPAGTYSNAVRFRLEQNYADTIEAGGFSQVITYTVISFLWYSPATKNIPLLSWNYSINSFSPAAITATWANPGNVGFETAENAELNIYPNPASDFIYIESELLQEGNIQATLFDMSGKSVLQTTLNSQSNALGLQALPKGIYLLRLNGREKQAIRRVSIQ